MLDLHLLRKRRRKGVTDMFGFGCAVMHDLRLIHTDLKPENILFVSSDYVKVPDYKVCFRTTKAKLFIAILVLFRC